MRSSHGRGVLLGAAVALSLGVPGGVEAQEGCVAGDKGRNDAFLSTIPGVGRVTYIGGAYFACAGGVEIFADSAVAYESRGMSDLIGRVRYLEDGREMRAARARYFTNEGRLQAQGDVIVVDQENGSSIRDGDLVYLLETSFRPVSEMTVTVGADGIRPTAVLTPPPDTARTDSLGAPVPPSTERPEPYRVQADRIYLRGSGYFTASRDVVIERDSLFAYADSAEYDEDAEGLILVDDARVVGASYELTGRTITMTNPGGDASEVRAVREARLVGADVLLTAARIVVLLRDGALDRLVATTIEPADDAEPDSLDTRRPEALVEEFVLTADSLSVSAPGERLQRVFASGRARSVSTARDSLNADVLPPVARTDWLEGDTVIIRFVGSPAVPPLGQAAAAPVGATGAAADSSAAEQGAPADSTAAQESEAAADSVPPDVTTLLAEPDPTEEAEVEEIIARVRARSLYRLPPNDSTYRPGTQPPAVHYVVGQEIRIRLDSGEVLGMQVTGQTRGVHLEPLRRPPVTDSTARPPADTSAVVDTLAAPAVDTLAPGDTVPAVDTLAPGGTVAAVDTLATVGGPTVPMARRRPEGDGPMDETSDKNGHGGWIRLDEEYPWNRR